MDDRVYQSNGLREDEVWLDLRGASGPFAHLPLEALAIAQYAFTELLNNAIDHARATQIHVRTRAEQGSCAFAIEDDGVGVFAHLARHFHFESEFDAIAQLSKGKLTTDPQRHTGEGLFFSSKLADLFILSSHGHSWIVDNVRDDMSIAEAQPVQGTVARFHLAFPPARRVEDVFARYTEDLEFSKTKTVVKLFEAGETFISRSEAKRLSLGLERFKTVILDFKGVTAVGQGFVDELFRVWSNAHPDVRLEPHNMAPAVAFMVKRGNR